MAQVIDALLITFGIDTREFDKARQKIDDGTKNLRETSKKNADYMESQGKRAAGFFSSIKNEMLALAGVSLTFGGTLGFVKGMTNDLQALSNQATVLRSSAKELDGFGRAAEAAGSSVQSMLGSLSAVNDKMMAARQGRPDSGFMGALQMLSQDTGINLSRFMQDPNVTSQELSKQILEAIQKDPNKDRARMAGRTIGFDDAVINSANSGQLLRNIDRFTASSGITERNTKAAKEFNEQWTILAQNFDAFKNQLYSGLIPYVKQFSNYLNDISVWMRTHPKEIKDSLDSLFSVIRAIAIQANEAAESFGGWKNVITALIGLKVASWFLGISKALAGPGGLAFAIAALYPLIDGLLTKLVGKEKKDWLESHGVFWTSDGHFFFNKKDAEERQRKIDSGEIQTGSDRVSTMSPYQQGMYNTQMDLSTGMRLAIGEYQPNIPLNATAARLGPKGKALLNAMAGEFGMLEGKYGLPAGLLRGVAATESGGDPYAVSKAGAKGLFQFMPGTAKDMGLNGGDVYDPKKSAEAAAKYLHYLIMATGDTQSALQAYNWGLGNLQKKGMQNAPKETQEYYAKVVANMRAGAGMAADSVAPYRMPSQGGQSFHIQQMQVVTPASSVGKLSQDMSKSAQNRATLIGYDSGQSGG